MTASAWLRHGCLVPLLVAAVGAHHEQGTLRSQTRPPECALVTRSTLPEWFRSWFDTKGPSTQYDVSCYVNPFYQRGNFDGRGQLDLAVLVVERRSGKSGVLVVHRPGLAYYVVGAGTDVGGGDDLSWLDVWSVGVVPRSKSGRPGTGFVGEVLDLEKFESAGHWVGFNGQQYVWVQYSD